MAENNEDSYSEVENSTDTVENGDVSEGSADSSSQDGLGGKLKGFMAMGQSEAERDDELKAEEKAKRQAAPVKAKKVEAKVAVDVAADGGKQKYHGEPLMTVVIRNRFYRDGFRNLMRIVILEAVIIILLIVTMVSYMNISKPQDRYFATTADGRIMKLVPLDMPNMATSALMSWVAQSATEVMTFGFHDYQARLQKSSRHFTRHGWEGFTNALQKSKIIEAIEAANQVVIAKPKSAPVLIQEGVFDGKYRWVVDLPMQITYKSSSGSRVDNVMIRLVIDRVTSLENPYGVGIEQWIAQAN